MNRHWSEGKKVGCRHNKVDSFEFQSSRHEIIPVDVTVKAIFDVVFVKHVDYLTAYEIGENGREVKKNQGFLVVCHPSLGGRIFKSFTILKTQP